MKTSRWVLTALMAVLAGILFPAAASAHTVQICWKDNGPVTTFYAGTYHSPFEAPSPVGKIIIDGFGYPFSGWIYPSALPAGVQCSWSVSGSGVPAVQHYQTFTSSFAGGPHTVTFDATTVIQSPWAAFPPLTFGGGACADADFDGQCNDADACPLDFNNDGDADGKCANVDNCPLAYNPAQTDANGNGQGDACEGLVCGNGLLQGAEQCDDGNIAGGDGCSAICTVELADGPPNANAGVSFSVNEGQAVTLDGTASNDPDNDPLTFAWTQVGGTTVILTGANTSQPTFTAPAVALGGETLTFSLTVTANSVTDTETVSVTVVNVNNVPVADAGDPQSVAEGAPVALNGTNSYDADGDLLTYSWVQVGGTLVVITGANTANPSFAAPVISFGGAPGVVDTLVFKLSVSDGFAGGVSEDTVTVEITNVNNLPVADAGIDKTLNENSALALNGNASSDPDGDALTYSWSQIGGPVVALTGANTATPSMTTPFVGGVTSLTFELTVNDGYDGTSVDSMVVTVLNPNDPPVVSAAQPTIACLWPPDHKMVSVGITGVSDPNSNATITIDSVTQDEPTNGLGDGDTAVDAIINPNGTVLLRAERSGKGDGRVYHVHFTASDLEGSASGVVTVCVPHNRKSEAVDGGELYNSTE